MKQNSILFILLLLMVSCGHDEPDTPYMTFYQEKVEFPHVYGIDLPHKLVKAAVGNEKKAVQRFVEQIQDARVLGVKDDYSNEAVKAREIDELMSDFDELVGNMENPYELIERFENQDATVHLYADKDGNKLNELLVSFEQPDELHFLRLRGDFTEESLSEFILNVDAEDLKDILDQRN